MWFLFCKMFSWVLLTILPLLDSRTHIVPFGLRSNVDFSHGRFIRNQSIHQQSQQRVRMPPQLNYRALLQTEFAVNVLDYGANGNGTFDNTDSFNKALLDIHSKGGGYVYVPSGNYLFYGQITIPNGVTLIGTYQSVPAGIEYGTILLVYYGRNKINETLSFIVMNLDSTIKGFSIYYPQQICNSVPVQYPPTIYLNNSANAAVENINLVNPYIGIWIYNSPRYFVNKVEGEPIMIGVYVDMIGDTARIENTHFVPNWEEGCHNMTYRSFISTYGRAFVFGRSDWQYVFNTFSFTYSIGYHFIETINGATNGNFLGIGADGCQNHSIKIDQIQFNGLLITNGEFAAYYSDTICITCTWPKSHIYISTDNIGPVTFEGCSFWLSDNIVRLYGNSALIVSNSHFAWWGENQPAIYAQNGTLKVIGCNFMQKHESNNYHFELKSGLKKAIIVGNTFDKPLNASIDSHVQTAIGYNL